MPDQIKDRWNEMAERVGLSKCVVWSASRKKRYKARSKELDEGWFQQVLDACANLDDFNRGEDPNSTWRGVDIDYALSVAGAVKLIEGRCAPREDPKKADEPVKRRYY